MKYLVFAYKYCYLSGGANDLIGSADTLENAERVVMLKARQKYTGGNSVSFDEAHVYNAVSNAVDVVFTFSVSDERLKVKRTSEFSVP